MATIELLITTAQSVTRSTASRPSSVRAGTSTGSVPGADTRTGVLSRVDARTAKDLASFYRITMLPRVSPAAGFKHKTPVGRRRGARLGRTAWNHLATSLSGFYRWLDLQGHPARHLVGAPPARQGGHRDASVTGTEACLTITTALLQEANTRFHDFTQDLLPAPGGQP
jgi:hypothetical protein